jgi:hypothetical protein
MPTSLAAPARPTHDQLGALSAETASTRGAEGRPGVDPHVEVLDRSADAADDVVVQLGAGIPEGGRAAGRNSVGEAQLFEQLESRVDRRQRGVRQPRLHPGQHLLGGRMLGEIAECAVDQDALRGDAKAVFTESLFELMFSH